jgi:tetratricopeptide (TPR) repeat protein
VLDGSYRTSGNRIRVSAQLINGPDENCLWAEQYDTELSDLLDVQEDIARSIVGTLELAVSGERLIRRYTRNEDAQLFYMKGIFHLHKWSLDSVGRLVDYMRRVVAIEPAYAPAWVELAHAALAQVMSGVVPPANVMPNGMEAAHRAVSADPELAEAHGVLGLFEGLREYDWAEALSEFRIALKLNPGSPSVRYFHAVVLISLGRVEEAISELHQSLEADPFSVLANQHLCRLYTICGDYAQAIAYGKQAVEAGPTHWPAFARLGEAYVYSGELEQGLAWLEQSRSTAPAERRYFTYGLAAALCKAGKRGAAESLLSEGDGRSSEQYVPPVFLGVLAAELGYVDRAFEYFDQALLERDSFLLLVPTERSLDPIRKDARYAELLRRMNFSTPLAKSRSENSIDHSPTLQRRAP